MDKSKRNLLVATTLLAMSAYLFAPIDFIWFVALSLVLGIAESVIFLVQKKNRKIGILILFVEIFSLATYLGFRASAYYYYYYYYFAWNVVYFVLTLAILFAPCYIAFFQKQSGRKKTLLGFSCILLAVGMKSFVFDTRYYYAATGSCLVQDVRYFKSEGYYKVIGNHKLLRKNPDKLTEEDYEAILYLLNETDWLEENYGIADETLVDCDYIKHNSKYVCSAIGLYNINKCDIYRLRIPLDKAKYARLYIPKGTFTIYNESDIEKYYDKPPERIGNCFYKGLFLPPLTEERFLEWTK